MPRLTLLALVLVSALAVFGNARPTPVLTSITTVPPANSTTSHSPTSVTSSPPAATTWCWIEYLSPPYNAITSSTLVSGLQLGGTGGMNPGTAILSAKGYAQGWSYTNGGLGVVDFCHMLWLTIGSSTTSYKPLTWSFDVETSNNWVVSSTGILSASATTQYNATSEFLGCLSSSAAARNVGIFNHYCLSEPQSRVLPGKPQQPFDMNKGFLAY
ncbi:hypothetical protein FRB97_005080 [Tulasnella sp. 331]|nr:hypothetical protein FRB97_005080 [Tulasnella sp. 331]KAG8880674.1 hypothetical protein FRB98_004950 [Tulasnella sp. 332]